MTRPAHPEAGRFDSCHGDEGKTGPTVPEDKDAIIERLDAECDRLTAERDMLAQNMRDLLGWLKDEYGDYTNAIRSLSPAIHGRAISKFAAALAKLEDES